MRDPADGLKTWVRRIAEGVVVAILAWSVWSGASHASSAWGLGRDIGYPLVALTSMVAATPCSGKPLRPASSQAWDRWERPHLWLVTDCVTEANKIPTSLIATASFNAGTQTWSVLVSWTAPTFTSGLVKYRVERSVNQGPFLEIAQPTTTSHPDSNVTGTPATSYVYRVRTEYSGPIFSAPSNIDVATTIQFTDDNNLAGKVVDDQHIIELRTAIAAVCKTGGESTPIWPTDPTILPQQTVIKKAHIDELRAKVSECLAAVGVVASPYTTDTTLTAGVTTIKKEHVQELRNAVH